MTDQTVTPPKPEFWRRTPPALFPTLFGLLGLGLAWRAAAGALDIGITTWIGNVILAGVAVLFLFVLACYLSKLSVRPRVLLEDMSSIPGRAGAAALTLCVMLFAAAVAPVSGLVATGAFWIGLAGHAIIALAAIYVMGKSPQGLVVTPAWHLNFVGFIVAPLAGVSLGYTGLSQTILAATVIVAALIYGISLLQLSRGDMPPPQRPLLMIHLAPLSLFTTVASLLGRDTIALVFGVLAVGVAAVLASRVLYLTRAGFSPLWGAFTFPVAAFASAMFALSGQVAFLAWVGAVPLAIASIATPLIAIRVMIMWANGALAAKSGAAVA